MMRIAFTVALIHATIANAAPSSTADTVTLDAQPAPTSNIAVVTLDAQPAIGRTVRAKPAELGTAITGAVITLIAAADHYSLAIAGPPFARYRSRSTTSIEVEVGVPVRKAPAKLRLGKDVRAFELPAGKAAVLVFRGRHEQLPRAHAALDAWLADHAKRPAGTRWEVYVTNPLQTPDPDAQETRVIAPFAD